MKVKEIVAALTAEPLSLQQDLEKEYYHVFATDLMSDALAMIQGNNDVTLMLTGLANAQSLRTAEMLDVKLIILVRSKTVPEELLDLANDMGIALYTTSHSMYEACGRLYTSGLKPLSYE